MVTYRRSTCFMVLLVVLDSARAQTTAVPATTAPPAAAAPGATTPPAGTPPAPGVPTTLAAAGATTLAAGLSTAAGGATAPSAGAAAPSGIPSAPSGITSTVLPSVAPTTVSSKTTVPSTAPVDAGAGATASVPPDPPELTTASSIRGESVTEVHPSCSTTGKNYAPPFLQCVEVGCQVGSPCKTISGGFCCPYNLGWNTVNCCLKTNFNKPPPPKSNNYPPPYFQPPNINNRLPMYPPPYNQMAYQPSPFAAGRPVPYPPARMWPMMPYPAYPPNYARFR